MSFTQQSVYKKHTRNYISLALSVAVGKGTIGGNDTR